MPNDSSAVSDLIRQTHGRRLGTDPADAALFDCTNRAQPSPPKRSAVPARPAVRAQFPRLLDSVLPPPEPARDALDRFEPSPPTEEPEPRTRVWPFVVATLFAAAIGVLVPAYFTGAFDSRASVPPIQLPSVTPPPAPAPPPAAVVTPVEPTPPPVTEPAPVPAETTTDTPPAPPTAEVAAPLPAVKVRPASKRVAIKRAKPAVAKPIAKPVATKPVAPPVVEPEPPKPSPPKRQRQAADNENPL